MTRATAEVHASGPARALPDYDVALELMEAGVRATLAAGKGAPADTWIALAMAYTNRANTTGDAYGPVWALPDHDAAICLMEALRNALVAAGEDWPSGWQSRLAAMQRKRAEVERQGERPAPA